MRPDLTMAQWIQMAYPQEPDWPTVPDDTLVELVEDFSSEPACATMAIGMLAARHHVRAIELARWLVSHPDADEWLTAAANDLLHSD